MDGEPFDGGKAKKLIRAILDNGNFAISTHALKELEDDAMNRQDVVNVLRGGKIEDAPEEVSGTWRYRIRTQRFLVVVAFRSEQEFSVVTAWRLKR